MRKFPDGGRWQCTLLAGLCLISAAASGDVVQFEFNVGSPSVMTIRHSLAERSAILKAHFQAGAIGFTHDGLIAIREPGSLPRDTRTTVELLVTEENKDRSTLYREIARANGRPDWESQFQSVFAERWIRRAPVGWYYRAANGQWVRKLSPGAPDTPPATPAVSPFPGN